MKLYIPIVNQHRQIKGLFYNKNSIQEISIALFGDCNLRCSFCIDNQRFQSKPDQHCSEDYFKYTLQLIEKVLLTTEKSKIDFRFYGGELLQDKFSDNIFEAYDWLFSKTIDLCKQYNKDYRLQISSNLIFKNKQRVLALLNKYNIILYASFDLVGRYTKQSQIDLFLDNCQFFNDQLKEFTISFVASYDNIKAIKEKGENFSTFNFLYQNYRICFDYCNDNGRIHEVNESLLSDFCLFLCKAYPSILNIQELKQCYLHMEDSLRASCPIAFIIQNKLLFNCCNHDQISQDYANRKHCLSCEYFLNCPHYCQRLLHKYSDCHIKAVYDYFSHQDL